MIEPVHRDPEVLAWAVANELNERSSDYEGRWISFLPDVLEQIAADPCQRHLLAISERVDDSNALSAVCSAIVKRGYVVLQGTVPAQATAGHTDVFHVAIGGAGEPHLQLSASCVPNCLMPARIADEFIDWDRAKNLVPAPRADVTNRFGNRSISQTYLQQDSCCRFAVE
ncbi:MAG: hypothetical protein QM755_09585 [Luteolibacter sp.]